MKTVVSVQDLLEREIKPNALLGKYRALTAASVAAHWPSPADLVAAACQGCGRAGNPPAFDRMGFTYRHCTRCGTLSVSPRPGEASLVKYYRDSPAARFWRERILPATAAAREEKLVRPRVEWVLEGVAEYDPEAATAIDVSPYGGPLADALLRARSFRRLIAASGQADLDYDPATGVDIRPSPISGIPHLGPVDVVLAFDAIDRADDVRALAHAAAEVLRPGGLLFATASNASGFELQVLWDRSPTVAPPDKLNLLSAEGLRRTFGPPAWDLLELSTPGMFDVEMVRRGVQAEPTYAWPRFIHRLVEQDEAAAVEFQEYLQRHRLASFARLVAQRAA